MINTHAISFDLWDTVLVDDSDEPERRRRSLLDKPTARRVLIRSALLPHCRHPAVAIDEACDTTDAAFRQAWREQHRTWTVTERIDTIIAALEVALPLQKKAALVDSLERMEVDIPPVLAPEIREALTELDRRYKLVVISDAIFSPGWALRSILDAHGLLSLFTGFVFSDELGVSKPDPRCFEVAAQAAGVAPERLIHIGDREHNDVDGAHCVGARAILTTVVVDRDSATTRADAICRDYAELAATVDRMVAHRG